MNMLRNQRGLVLITSYLVVLVLLALSSAFFSRAIHEKRLVQRHSDSLKALYQAEKAVAYAYYESADKGWAWFTHDWNSNQRGLLSEGLTAADALRTQGGDADCYFIIGGADNGCYASNDGSFILKAFPDPEVDNVTVVRAKGISNQVERAVEYRISREAIFDFAWWTPYDLNLDSVGRYVNGGRIHANGSIYMGNSKRLEGVDTISTGQDQSIYYDWDSYYAPGYYDYYLADPTGSRSIDGEIPLLHLDTPRRWAGTTEEEEYGIQYPWLQDNNNDGIWGYHNWTYGNAYVGSWPPRDWRNEEYHFYGSSEERYNTTVGGQELNTNNTWIYPARKNADGELIFDVSGDIIPGSAAQIPAELEGAMWDWEKYNNFSGTFSGNPQQELKFTVYDPADPSTPKYVEDTRWKIDGGEVVMTGLEDPAGRTYWAMLEDPNYWTALGYSADDAQSYSTHINPEVLDGTYGSEIPAGQSTIEVDNTNSMLQPAAWNDFLEKSGLDDVLFANERGEDMESPRFATTYRAKSENAGLCLSKSEGDYTLNYGNATAVTYSVEAADACGAYSDYTTPQDYWDCTEDSIDVLVERLNRRANNTALPQNQRPARKVKFINTYTNQTNVLLELDLAKMRDAGTYPANGIIYSEVPIRLNNADLLPSQATKSFAGNVMAGLFGSFNDQLKKDTFNVICEENVYLKGDYNHKSEIQLGHFTIPLDGLFSYISDKLWMPSAIISKKFVYELSDSFNDPGWSGYDDGFDDTLSSNTDAVPAFRIYPNYPYIYVASDADGNLVEANPAAGDGNWVYYGNYLTGSAQRQQAYDLMNGIQNAWWAAFDRNDPTGMQTYTTDTGHPIIDGQEWGAMPNRVENDTTYNCLMASYWNNFDGRGNESSGMPTGALLERWIRASQYGTASATEMGRIMNGAYFQLDSEGFAALSGEGVDLVDIPRDIRPASRPYGGGSWGPYYQGWDGNNPRSYDARLRNSLLAQNRSIFFGGGSSSWREIDLSAF